MVDGALVVKQIYCHPHGADNYAVWKLLRERFIPYHFMEIDNSVNEAEVRLRIESLLNIIRPSLVRLRGWHTPNELQERCKKQ
jgi:benzoyl-CoA reductase/2-hydroxyglutaryl-CoA dehydratase subunit BcrC/BadD/HgdB